MTVTILTSDDTCWC